VWRRRRKRWFNWLNVKYLWHIHFFRQHDNHFDDCVCDLDIGGSNGKRYFWSYAFSNTATVPEGCG
jgi:hypothetical protein